MRLAIPTHRTQIIGMDEPRPPKTRHPAIRYCLLGLGWLLIALMKFERMPFLGAVKEAKMRVFVTPGELLKIEASILHEGSGFAITKAKVSVEGKQRCNATITFGHVPFPNPELRGHMETMARRIGYPQQAMPHD